MNKEKQLARINELLAPVLAWLEAGAKGEDFGFNMRGFKNTSYGGILPEDFKGRQCAYTVCMGGAILEFLKKDGKSIKVNGKRIKSYDIDVYFKRNFPDVYEDTISNSIFYPDIPVEFSTMKPRRCARVLRHYMETGELDWSLYHKKKKGE